MINPLLERFSLDNLQDNWVLQLNLICYVGIKDLIYFSSSDIHFEISTLIFLFRLLQTGWWSLSYIRQLPRGESCFLSGIETWWSVISRKHSFPPIVKIRGVQFWEFNTQHFHIFIVTLILSKTECQQNRCNQGPRFSQGYSEVGLTWNLDFPSNVFLSKC